MTAVRRIRALLVLAILTLAGPLFAPVTLANAAGTGIGMVPAHDQVVSTSPANGVTFGTSDAPDQVSITMNEAPLQVGTEVRVSRDGALVSTGQPSISGTVVTQRIDPQKKGTGEVKVAYRVTSADGHPIAGSFGYTVRATGAMGVPADPGADGDGTVAHPSEQANSQAPMIPIVLGAVSILLLLGLAALIVKRRHPPRRLD